MCLRSGLLREIVMGLICLVSPPSSPSIYLRYPSNRRVDLSNPGSWEDVVELLVPELQREESIPRGTFRENMR